MLMLDWKACPTLVKDNLTAVSRHAKYAIVVEFRRFCFEDIRTVRTVRMRDPSHQSHTENAMVLLSPADDFITHNFKAMDGSSDSDEHLVAAHVHASLT